MKNETKIKRGSVGVLDLALIIVIIATLFGAYILSNSKKISLITTKSENVIVTLNIKDTDGMSKGDLIYFDTDSYDLFGTVISSVPIHNTKYQNDENSKTLTKTYTGEVKGTCITVSVNVKKSNDGLFASGEHFITVGKTVMLKCDDKGSFSGYIDKIES